MVVGITKEFRFEAAHFLSNHKGKCARLHGHSYRMEVTVERYIETEADAPDEGMVIDFANLSLVWKVMESEVDHRLLMAENQKTPEGFKLPSDWVAVLPVRATTAECLAEYFLDRWKTAMEAFGVNVEQVTLWETATGSATAR